MPMHGFLFCVILFEGGGSMPYEILYSFLVSLGTTILIVPLVRYFATTLQIVAKMNERTVHTTEIGRIGGMAIYFSFLVGSMIFLKTDSQINSILIGGFLIFIIGLYDDMNEIKAIYKLLVQLIAALIVIFYGGILLKGFDFSIPYLPEVMTLLWIVGITNAINLIDGLDGLSAGISTIVLFTISFTSMQSGRTDIAALSLILAGSLTGFLFYNFYPAKIFMGDCGALFTGFMIAVISLLGFGYNVSTFFTLGAPIIVLMIPIMDTVIAIVRRKLQGKKFSEADRKHLHHRLMYKFNLGHRKSVIVLYLMTVLFSITSFVYLYDATIGFILFIVIMIFFELFVELSNMITAKYKPLLTLLNIVLQRDDLPKLKMTDKYLNKKHPHTKLVGVGMVCMLCFGIYMAMDKYEVSYGPKDYSVIQSVYTQSKYENSLLASIYKQLDSSYKADLKEKEYQLLAAYFVVDYLSFGLHLDTIGGIDLVHEKVVNDFITYAYSMDDFDIEQSDEEEVIEEVESIEVTDYKVISHSPSSVRIDGIDSNQYYNVMLALEYNIEHDQLPNTTNVLVVFENGVYYVVGLEFL